MAATTSQPISLPTHAQDQNVQDVAMSSVMSSSGSFNPASYTRHFLDSPLSWRDSSFGTRYYTGVSPMPGSLETKLMSTSVESDRGSLANAVKLMERADEHCRNFTCCGLNLTDLHALVDHFEESHVVIVDPHTQQTQLMQPPTWTPAQYAAYAQAQQQLAQQQSAQQSMQTQPTSPTHSSHEESQAQNYAHTSEYSPGPFDPDDMEFDESPASSNPSPMSSGASTPPDTPLTTPLSAYPSPQLSSSPVSAFDTTVLLRGRSAVPYGQQGSDYSPLPSTGARSSSLAGSGMEEAFSAFRGYSDYSSAMPGAVSTPIAEHPSPARPAQATSAGASREGSPYAVSPALVFSSTENTPAGTPAASRVASPAPNNSYFPASASGGVASSSKPSSSSTASGSAGRASTSKAAASTTLSRPASSLLLSKPFRCPKPNCNKSYKQANGLKYHMTHGSCNFAPPKDLEQVQALLASKLAQKGISINGEGVSVDGEGGLTLNGTGLENCGINITEQEMREVEREAERRLRPFACGIGDCQRRYKNMNGLRYHYQHSGDHGAIGLTLLASGQHESLRNHAGHGRSSSSNTRHSTPSTPTTGVPPRVRPTPSQPASRPNSQPHSPVAASAQATHQQQQNASNSQAMQSALAQFQQFAAQNPVAFQQRFGALAAQAQAQNSATRDANAASGYMPWTQSQRQ
ncbi:hypothetical protein PUNSTDRAFT_122954 [Punctularia strigosozonata HHB-11173 SS5]|uniref:C2H2-type domain-containing protein n=1 Tax=Punctularia strigosozonata (strain HHB-11173) TaxID=741275 RepID=R7S2N2_PUNST|nr:uncharacterized protein PUNSTDRAFT_122954 [Punctularia strigosozonata HHB-11173 SS5]EIN04109.1 hypothetical protein PUNSTDRAFT_122954 [Punctularia strigosozonata HHB-11173 SS5]